MSTENKWIKAWNDNYYGRSDQAKELDGILKKNYQGHKYVPWATMVRMLYQQDPEASIEVLESSSTADEWRSDFKSNLVFTDERMISVEKDGKKTNVTVFSHFVKIKVVFLGKEIIEVYPIQNNAYGAPKDFDSNMVNKSIQRAKAKAISTATGLAFSLYENGDLQFEDDGAEVKDDIKPISKKKKAVVKTTPVKDPTVNNYAVENKFDDTIKTLAEFILEKKPHKVLEHVNKSFKSSYDTTLSTDDELPELIGKIARVKNPKIFANSFMKMCEREGIV